MVGARNSHAKWANPDPERCTLRVFSFLLVLDVKLQVCVFYF